MRAANQMFLRDLSSGRPPLRTASIRRMMQSLAELQSNAEVDVWLFELNQFYKKHQSK